MNITKLLPFGDLLFDKGTKLTETDWLRWEAFGDLLFCKGAKRALSIFCYFTGVQKAVTIVTIIAIIAIDII